ncbi:hypothetical protein ACFO25_01665 [Paenactinomyces guangxiensis]|uniref:TcaA 4th domain-containing protein n=1 Tax=Paenactinomyces guangxiensis TaxID=1490290 RepID=A0A7W1WRW5_9BACL|nr:hypothetical protein [Paenactinomyces guangxiensis]MBA4494937.1 hypothetical protein [Paenactinomyces guangxiensis]MBH8592020.1 hypothetical protein [Paenactinomyces guangxiensis]
MNAQKSLYEGQDVYGSQTLRQRSNQDIMSSGEFYLKKDEGIFSDSYIIGVRPQYLEITFKSNQGLIKVDGKEVWKVNKNQNKKKIGPLFPGNHKVYVESYFSYANMTLKEEHQENLLGLSQTTEARYELTGSGIKATSKHAGVQVYMNNQKTPFIIYVGNGDTTVYPVKYDGSQTIYGVAKYPWGESKKSKSIRIDDASKEYDVTPPLFPSAKAKESFMDVLKAFGEDRAKVLTTKNPGHYRNIHPKHRGNMERRERGLCPIIFS